MRTRSKSTLFLIEQLIVIAVFAICAAACISILANAFFLARDSRDVSNALLVAERVAESFKAFAGDFEKTAEMSGGTRAVLEDGSEVVLVFINEQWQVSDEADAHFFLKLSGDYDFALSNLLSSELSVVRMATGESLVAFPVAVRR
ncbi:MAG: hypothetical protein FWC66_02675 [Oscillospiraceae bacterium]|nr:hypothetical protein [Oscillospiraceae bacterium]